MALLYWLIMFLSQLFMAGGSEAFESLPVWQRVLIPIVACFVLAVIFTLLPAKLRSVGVPYVVERLNYHQGILPVLNAVVQFFTVAISLIGGLSIGKEGPAVHLGATFGSYLAQHGRLPQYGVETLVACGVAGAIAAAFQTPVAGVLFAFEVIFIEYRMGMALPVLLSSVVGMLVSEYLLGRIEVFDIDHLSTAQFTPDFFIACLALVGFIVTLAFLFLKVQKVLWRVGKVSVWWRFSLVGGVTSVVAIYLPETLGGGYDSLIALLSGQTLVSSLLAVIIVKTLLTSVSIGLGIPGGMIGPTFVIGGLAGAQAAFMFDSLLPYNHEMALFILLGMAAMMAACFQAPLTALIAMIEMTHTSEVIVPAMLVIVLSCLIMRLLLRQESAFVQRLKYVGLSSSMSPFKRYLQHHTVMSVAEPVVVLPAHESIERLKDLGSSVVDYVAFEVSGQWMLARREAVLSALQSIHLGPSPFLVVDGEQVLMDLSKALDCTPSMAIPEPTSLEKMLSWFQASGRADVLIEVRRTEKMCLVSRRQLDQFLLKDN
ncbi:H+/Cl- antiporter ClcA [Marinomonas pollencensis]|uniref:H+/Cl-antiporter ClcA n=2 Tax=Marinomonas pollencensis TaxID=491954 RepID=A0A3E0DGS5_9GAMM|nr:H+/Cl- antiporter ClcA [Marinomonas pollencensis]